MNSNLPNTPLTMLTLGKTTHYCDQYNPDLLQSIPRRLARDRLNLNSPLPFHGADIWTLYELSWLNDRGMPQVAIGSVDIDASSQQLVESKSFKLYLNSFTQTQFPAWQTVQQTIQRDLSACLNSQAHVTLSHLHQYEGQPISPFAGECIDDQPITITDYQLNPRHLENATGQCKISETLVSHLLKSNCLITHQPDWSSLQIHYQGRQINRKQLLRYLVSFRHHNEFHEHCVERIWCDLMHYCQPQTLSVYARYTRRGGLDINPWRSNDPGFTPSRHRLVRQ